MLIILASGSGVEAAQYELGEGFLNISILLLFLTERRVMFEITTFIAIISIFITFNLY